MKAPVGGGGDYPVLEDDVYVGRIYSVVDIGMQEGTYGTKNQIIITWELPTECVEDLPQAISKFYTLSLNAKANLRKDIESMTSKIPDDKITDTAFQESLFPRLLGKTSQLSISKYKNAEGYERNKITAVTKIMKGTDVPRAVNAPVFFDLDNYDQGTFDALPEWQQKMINKEGAAATPAPAPAKSSHEDTDDDDIQW